jgi:hypothetical protein
VPGFVSAVMKAMFWLPRDQGTSKQPLLLTGMLSGLEGGVGPSCRVASNRSSGDEEEA